MIIDEKTDLLTTLLLDSFHSKEFGKFPVLEIDKDGKIIFANSMLLTMLGKKEGEVCGNYFTKILEPSTGNSRVFHYKWNAIRNGKTEAADFFIISEAKKKYLLRFRTVSEGIYNSEDYKIIFSCEQIIFIREKEIKKEVSEFVYA